ncbi:MAG: hypothetical protein CMJ75_18320 [Planctomycetaceae bacterium]|nr:hypothetical protein [Planctomycetaceae bacterium]
MESLLESGPIAEAIVSRLKRSGFVCDEQGIVLRVSRSLGEDIGCFEPLLQNGAAIARGT